MDCLDGMKLIDSGTVDMILTDLPYGITQCEWDKPVLLDLFWEQARRIIKDNGAIVLTAKQPFTTDLINSNRDWYPTGIACMRTERKYIGSEKEKKYFDIGTERAKLETVQLSLFE